MKARNLAESHIHSGKVLTLSEFQNKIDFNFISFECAKINYKLHYVFLFHVRKNSQNQALHKIRVHCSMGDQSAVRYSRRGL